MVANHSVVVLIVVVVADSVYSVDFAIVVCMYFDIDFAVVANHFVAEAAICFADFVVAMELVLGYHFVAVGWSVSRVFVVAMELVLGYHFGWSVSRVFVVAMGLVSFGLYFVVASMVVAVGWNSRFLLQTSCSLKSFYFGFTNKSRPTTD